MDILCQAKSGMGKTAVFVLATFRQLEPTVICHTHELAFQISEKYELFSKYMPETKIIMWLDARRKETNSAASVVECVMSVIFVTVKQFHSSCIHFYQEIVTSIDLHLCITEYFK